MFRKLTLMLWITFAFSFFSNSQVINLTNNLIDLISFTKALNGELSYDPYRATVLLKFGTNTLEFFESKGIGIINSNFILPSSLVRSNFSYYLSISQIDYIVSLLEIPCVVSNFVLRDVKIHDVATSDKKDSKNFSNLATNQGSGDFVSTNVGSQEVPFQGTDSFRPIKFVIIDAGHGGKDPGAIHNGIKEKDLTLEYSRVLYRELAKRLPKNIKVYLTRDRDVYLSLEERVSLANNLLKSSGGYGIFVSIHMNASPVRVKKGVEVYFISDKAVDSETRETLAFENAFIDKRELQKVGELEKIIGKIKSVALMEESRILSENVARQLSKVEKDLKIKGGPFYVIKYIPVPSVLLEIGYISNPESVKLLVSETYQNRVAELVSEGILEFISTYNQTRGFTFSQN